MKLNKPAICAFFIGNSVGFLTAALLTSSKEVSFSQPATAPNAPTDPIVCVSKGGKCYHALSCQSAKNAKHLKYLTQSEAIALGKTPHYCCGNLVL